MDLVTQCIVNGWRRVAFIGTAKHAGKTTALNAFIARAGQARFQSPAGPLHSALPRSPADRSTRPGAVSTLGLLSVGLDGERLDTILGVSKPAIEAPSGTIIASAERALADSDAELEYLAALPIESPLGTVLVARVQRAGRVVLAGIRQRHHVELAAPALEQAGADLVLIDGAFDRVAAAAPDLVDAVVIAVGAIHGRTVEDAARHAFLLLQKFRLPEIPADLKAALQPAREQDVGGVLIASAAAEAPCAYPRGALPPCAYPPGPFPRGGISPGASPSEPSHAALTLVPGRGVSDFVRCLESAAPSLACASAHQPSITCYVPGAVTTTLLEALARCGVMHLVAAHPAQILASAEAIARWFRRGHRLSVWRRVPIAAIAVNPHSITGYDLPSEPLQDAIRQIAPGIPVINAKEWMRVAQS
ncbi:hypothetical protein JI721_05885 [Alicyclobacillus cycloheptanicus]|uniref:Uncharacterized protein n=1 Tax=Alicyclobacillus cycloheptanicus TaxID=1457 RepID=A0ABT9XGN8_9BACL|nr:hypothetical protein [Alicyclobacillus cycloheptanicus]MDQ0189471.1 hypothetical protein [Alicyclobacillus cycloheptanicus]WDM02337.1 hypothetical protein JI721_05885 [Alicyclobacillus cycloheptanicus]